MAQRVSEQSEKRACSLPAPRLAWPPDPERVRRRPAFNFSSACIDELGTFEEHVAQPVVNKAGAVAHHRGGRRPAPTSAALSHDQVGWRPRGHRACARRLERAYRRRGTNRPPIEVPRQTDIPSQSAASATRRSTGGDSTVPPVLKYSKAPGPGTFNGPNRAIHVCLDCKIQRHARACRTGQPEVAASVILEDRRCQSSLLRSSGTDLTTAARLVALRRHARP